MNARIGLAVALGILTAPGCLSLGGTTYTTDPEMSGRLSSLESRVSNLEQTVIGTSAPRPTMSGFSPSEPEP